MADNQNMVTDPVGQDMEQQAAQGEQAIQGQAPAGEGGVGPAQDPVSALQAKEQDTVSSGDSSGAQKPKGTLEDQRREILAKNPRAKLPATPSMQAEYIQIITRFFLYIHDTRQSATHKSPCELYLKQMNNPKLTVAQAVGQATATAIFILHNAAKHQKVKYNPNVLFRAADECCAAMYLMGCARGIFQNVPKFKGKKAGTKYTFEPAERMLLLKAKMFAVQFFGNLMKKSGQLSDQDATAAKKHWDDQIKREIASGQVTDAHVQQLMNNPQVKSQMQSVAPQGPPDQNAAISDSSGQQAQPPQQGQQPPDQGQGVAPQQPPQGAQEQQ